MSSAGWAVPAGAPSTFFQKDFAHGTASLDINNSTLTYSLNLADPSVEALQPNQTLQDSVTVPVQGGPSTTVAFTIDGVVHPTGLNTTASVNQSSAGNPTQVILHPQATDPISTHLTYEAENLEGSAANHTPHGTLAQNPDGSFTYTPNAGFYGTDAIHFIAKDGQFLASDDFTVTVTINPVVAAVEGGNSVVSGNLLANDTNPNDAIVSVTLDAAADNTFTVDGLYGELVVNANGHYSYTLGFTSAERANLVALGDGHSAQDVFTYTISDGTVSSDANLVVEVTDHMPTISIATVAGDNVVNATEASAGFTITGSETGADGRAVTVAIVDGNGHVVASYTTTASEGGWSVNVTGQQATTLADGSYTVTADVTDQFGNPATEATQTLAVHETLPTISIAAIAGDNVVNESEANAGFAITGSETGADGRPVAVAIVDGNGHVVASYTTTASAGSWSVGVTSQQATALADGSYTVTANVSDQFGNQSALATRTFTVNEAPPVILSDLTTASGSIIVPAGAAGSPLTALAVSYLTDGHDLVNGLGGSAGFGANALDVGDDNSSSAINIASVFGPQGLNFFGHDYTSIYINNNGNITFAGPTNQFTPAQINGGANNPIIAPFWADVDTRGGAGTSTGGNANGANRVYYNLDATDGVLTVTWDDVGYYSSHNNKLDAFQVQLVSLGNGNFDIVYRYQDINWTTGDASGGSGGLGGQVARAGFSAGDGVHYFELPQSGNQAQMLALETTTGNTGIAGVDVFQVSNGEVFLTTSGHIDFTDADTGDVHSISNVTYTGSGQALGTLTFVKDSDTSSASHVGQFTWTYSVPTSSVASFTHDDTRAETFDVTIGDGNGNSAVQTISVILHGPDQAPVAVNDTAAAQATHPIATGNLLANDHDPDGDTLTLTGVVNGEATSTTITVHGTYGDLVVTKATGDYTYTLGATAGEQAALVTLGGGHDTFTYTVDDGHGGSAQANLTVTATGHNVLLVGNGGYATIQAAINAAVAGDIVDVANGTYNENVALKNGVSVLGASQAGVVINGTLSTPASFDDTTVSNLTVTNPNSTSMLLDMTRTSEITDSVFSNDTFKLTSDFTGLQAIGNGQVSGSIALHGDGGNGGAGLTFQGDTLDAANYQSGSTAFAYSLFHSVNGAQLVLNDVSLEGENGGIGAQWNMSPNANETSDVTIENSSTSGGGNFYVSGMASATITGNTFDNQGLALNGVQNGTVTGNTFENIDGSITANGTQHRGLVIEDAWGAPGNNNISVTDNTFNNITATDGAIALQRFMVNGTQEPATIDQLSNVAVTGNTFTGVADPIYLDPGSFGAGSGSVIPAGFNGSQFITGTSGNDSITDTATGNVTIFAGAGRDTANYGSGYSLENNGVQWEVTNGTKTDTLYGVEKVVIAGKTYDLVDHFGQDVGGFQTIQSAVNAATAGDTIEVAAGTYVEQVTVNATAVGVVANSLTGLTIEGMAGAVLQAPTTPLVSTGRSPSSGRDIDSVLALENTSGVTVTGLTVDGNMQGANLAGGQNNPTEVGIAVLNATGTVLNGVTVENVRESDAGFGNQRGLAVYDGNTTALAANTFEIENSTISNFQKNGITTVNAAVTVTNNTITGVVTNNQAQNAIEIDASTGTVSHNTISSIGYTRDDGVYEGSGILAFDHNGLSPATGSLSIDHNTITLGGKFTTGVFAVGLDNAQNDVSVTNNSITGAGPTGDPNLLNDGVDYTNGTNGGAISGNTVTGFDIGIKVDRDSTGPGGAPAANTAPPTVTGNVFGSAIGSEYFQGDGSFVPTLQSVAQNSMTNASGPGQITVTDNHGNPVIDTIFSSIQAAINAAVAGDIVHVGAGTYNEFVNVDKAVTIAGANVGVAGIGTRGAETSLTGGLEITAAGATVDGVAINGSYDSVTASGTDLRNGMLIAAANVTVENSVFTGDALDSRPFSTLATQTGLDFEHNLVSGWAEGSYIVEGSTGTIAHNTFLSDGNGVVTESIGVQIDNNTFNSSGFGDADTAAGADVVPLPFGDATIGNFVFGNTYTPGEARPITVYLNGPVGQTVTGSDVSTTFNTEYHSSGASTVTGGAGDDLFIGGAYANTFNGGDGTNTISYQDDSAGVTINLAAGTASGPAIGATTFTSIQNAIGGRGNDTFTGDGVSSVLTGGGGIDTVDYIGATVANLSVVNGHWTVSGGSGGTDTLSNIDKVDNGSHDILLVGDGGFATIQAAVNAAAAGDTIDVAAGTYNEHVDINKAVTLDGANFGLDGDGARGAESVITGGMKISADGATLDGVEISGSYSTLNTPDITSPPNIGLLIAGAHVTVENSVFTGDALVSRPFGTTGAATDLSFEHNLVENWTRGGYLTAGSSGSISDNAFLDNGNGVFSEGMSFVVSGNTFSGSAGSDVSGYTASANFNIGTVVHDNTYSSDLAQPISVYLLGPDGETVDGSDVATTFHLEYHSGSATVHGGAGSDAISYADDTAGVTIDLAAGTSSSAGGTATFTSIENAFGGSGNDTLKGNSGNNVLDGGLGGHDTLTGNGGNDTFVFHGGQLTVTDFQHGQDQIDVSAFGFTQHCCRPLSTPRPRASTR